MGVKRMYDKRFQNMFQKQGQMLSVEQSVSQKDAVTWSDLCRLQD